MDLTILFSAVRQALLETIPETAPIVVALDDTLLPKSGKKTHGAAYRRDPLGPSFRPNFIWAQRFVQVSAASYTKTRTQPADMVPIDFRHAPTPAKPSKKAPAAAWDLYKKQKKQMNLSLMGVQCINDLRNKLDQNPKTQNRTLVVAVDGSYTNQSVLKNLPPQTTLIGRIRKDAKLSYLPEHPTHRGRKRIYGESSPTPEQLRSDPLIPYQKITAWAAGRPHDFKVKTIGPLRWRKAGGHLDLTLIVIAPLRYRLTKNTRLLYRQPAYLICSNPHMPLQEIIQFYLWRWDIEVNFRDEKTLLGVGQAQVRTQASVMNVPAFIVAAYAMLLIAAQQTFKDPAHGTRTLPPPKWQSSKARRLGTQKLVNHLRAELWGPSLGLQNFSHFVDKRTADRTHKNTRPNLESAVLYAIN